MAGDSAAAVFSSKGDLAYSALRQQILNGDLPPGSRLAQYEVARTLQMSITPLREAIRRLNSEGLLDVDSHRDVRIPEMSSAEARQLFEVRRSLEPTAAQLAAARRTDQDLERIEEALKQLVPVTRTWGEEGISAHRAFHQALYRACGNDVLVRMLDDIWDKTDRYRRLGLELPPGDEPRLRDHRDHHHLKDLVEHGQGAEAAELMRQHIDQSLTAKTVEVLLDRETSDRTS